jgi:hypothetical protein
MPRMIGLIAILTHKTAEPGLGQMVETPCYKNRKVSGVWAQVCPSVYFGWVRRRSHSSAWMARVKERREVFLVPSGRSIT